MLNSKPFGRDMMEDLIEACGYPALDFLCSVLRWM